MPAIFGHWTEVGTVPGLLKLKEGFSSVSSAFDKNTPSVLTTITYIKFLPFSTKLYVPSGLAARNVWGLPAPPANVLAFIQTAVVAELFRIHQRSRLSLPVRHMGPLVENKIALPPVLK